MIYLYIAQIINLIFPLITLPYLSRILSKDSFGAYALAYNWALILQQLIDFGFYLTAPRDVAQMRKEKEGDLKYLIGNILGAKLTLVFIGFCATFLLYKIGPVKSSILMIGSFMWGIAWFFSPTWFLQGIEQLFRMALVDFLGRLIGFLSILAFVRSSNDAHIAVGAPAIAMLLVNTVFWIPIVKRWGIACPDLKEILITLNRSKDIFIYRMCVISFTLINPWILGFFRNSAEVGIYYGGEKIAKSVLNLIDPAVRSLLPRISFLCLENHEKAFRSTLLAFQWLLIVGLIAGLFVFIKGPLLVKIILGDNYLESISIVRIFLFAIPFVIISKTWGALWLVSLGQDRKVASAFVIGAVINLIIAPLIARIWGARGVAGVSVLVEAVIAFVIWYFSQANKPKREQ